MQAEPRNHWPAWKNCLPAPKQKTGGRIEGGLRCKGMFKSSRPEEPLITYVTVVRNGQTTLARTIKSVQDQKYKNVEHIILDGASTDDTLRIIEQNADCIDYFASEADCGLYNALNKGIELARGDLICVLNSDDWLTPEAAGIAAQLLQKCGENPCLLLSAAWIIGTDTKPRLWTPGTVNLGSYLSCANVCHNAIYATRSAYEQTGPYTEDLPIAADFQWIMRCVDTGAHLLQTDQPTTYYSLGGISSDTIKHSRECAQVIKNRFSYLSDNEVWGLYHCLHTFKDRPKNFKESSPAHKGEFLLDLARRHSDHQDLLSAIALASLEIVKHPQDQLPPGKLSRIEKWKRSLAKRRAALLNIFFKT